MVLIAKYNQDRDADKRRQARRLEEQRAKKGRTDESDGA